LEFNNNIVCFDGLSSVAFRNKSGVYFGIWNFNATIISDRYGRNLNPDRYTNTCVRRSPSFNQIIKFYQRKQWLNGNLGQWNYINHNANL